jgi:hypothetical protein
MHATTRRGCGLALLSVASALAAPPTAPVQRIESPLGVSFELPAGWVEAPSEIPWVQRFQPERCAPDATPSDCPTFLVLQRMQPIADADAVALSRRRGQAMAPAWRGSAEGVHDDRGAWRAGRYTLGAIDAAHWITNLVDGDVGWELTGWSTPDDAEAMASVYRAAGASLRVRHDRRPPGPAGLTPPLSASAAARGIR